MTTVLDAERGSGHDIMLTLINTAFTHTKRSTALLCVEVHIRVECHTGDVSGKEHPGNLSPGV